MKLPIYFISDNHFFMDSSPNETNRRKLLFSLFKKIQQENGTLIIGGDFFDFWFDYGDNKNNSYKDIFHQLDKLSSSGVEIHYVLGNHDYWDFGYFNKKFGAKVYKDDLDLILGQSKIQITHGDGLLKNDGSYRLMKKIIRSRLCISLFKNFHPDWGCALAKKVSRASGDHHHNLNSEAIRKELIQYAKTQWKIGINTVLIGHYHQTGIIEEDGNFIIFMGDWLRHFTITRLDENGWWQGKWDEV